jgi:carbon-monoxide dehydrogenase large subunit
VGLVTGRGWRKFVGEAVALVVAETRPQTDDAAEPVDVEYEPLPVVVDAEAALHEDFPSKWHPGCPKVPEF